MGHPLPLEADSQALLQWMLLFAMALQLPNYFDQVMELLDLHYHGFPLLVILGTLISKRNTVQVASARHQDSSKSSSSLLQSQRESLLIIEEYYRNNSVDDDYAPLESSSVQGPMPGPKDEWGHFTDFDEGILDDDINFSLPPVSGRPTSRRQSLSILTETEEDE